MNTIKEYLDKNMERFLLELQDLLRFPSISSLPEKAEETAMTAQWLAQHMKEIGLQNVMIIQTKRHPLVTGEWILNPGLPTVLVYGHYDVQPVDPEQLWVHPPFEPIVKGQKVYARGASDDKGQLFMHLKAVEALLAVKGGLPYNVRFLFEGEEEVGSESLQEYLADGLVEKPDVIIISDTNMVGPNQPAICYGLRGIVSMEMIVKTGQTDLHSGLFGGAVPNALHTLSYLITHLHDERGKVNVPGFYDDVIPMDESERDRIKAHPFYEDLFIKENGLKGLVGEDGFHPLEQMWARPTLEVNGLWGGFIGEGTKTVIPAQANAKITCRLVPNQDPIDIYKKVEAYLQKIAPAYSDIKLHMKEGAKAWICPTDHPALQVGLVVLEKAFLAKPLLVRGGGSVPIVETFNRIWDIPIVLMGFGLPTDRVHAPNENFNLDVFAKGIYTICLYWEALAKELV